MTRRAPAARRRLRQNVRFRRAALSDLDLLVEHRLAMWRDIGTRSEDSLRDHAPVYRRWIRALLARGEVEAVIAEVPGRPVGSGALWWMPAHPRPGLPDPVEPYLMSMYTDPEYRGAGLATDIVLALLDRARQRGAFRALLHASTQGRPVYKRLGFEPTTEMRLLLKSPVGVQPASGAVRSRARAGSRR
ncbi:MAG TPA: GNAT family N-acetyltransferase [Thermoplasmata archaeon]|nr:GNAT family N-acetyltransferase [Thermoplasmata archaeon]